jgi:thioredoxin reductase (NADPH)
METIGADLRQAVRTPLADWHVEALRKNGEIVTYAAGDYVARPGERIDRFVYVESGEIEVVNPMTGERQYASTIGAGQFLGEVSLLYGGASSLPLRTVKETLVIEVAREKMLTLMSQIPEMSDIIITVFSGRRRRQLEEQSSSLYLIGEETDRRVRKIAEFANRNRIPYVSLPLQSKDCVFHATVNSVSTGS